VTPRHPFLAEDLVSSAARSGAATPDLDILDLDCLLRVIQHAV
jgi:hypothetical protein